MLVANGSAGVVLGLAWLGLEWGIRYHVGGLA